MGQKVHPLGFRLGITKTWKSRWYGQNQEYIENLHEDLKIRKFLSVITKKYNADVADIEIIRSSDKISVIIHTSRPGVLIGSKGATIEKINVQLQKIATAKVQLKIKEIKKPEINAQLIALNVARQLKSRATFRRVMKMAIANARKNHVQGIKIQVSGRLAGADMARTETLKEGRVPLHTLRSDIDYGFAEANTTFGIIGIKVWVCNGEVLKANQKFDDAGMVHKNKKQRKVNNVKS